MTKGSVSFIVSGLKSLKIIGRNRVQFHMDQLVLIQKQPVDGKYFWLCRLGETGPHRYGQGVMCSVGGINYATQHDAEEKALEHLVNVHRASGGERKPRNRGQIRRTQKIQAWNDRRHRDEDGRVH